jgi:hypothetical protein
MTKEQLDLQAANARLGVEIAALRELLAVVAALADVPEPDGGYYGPQRDAYAAAVEKRADTIAIYARMDEAATGNDAAWVLRSRARHLREEAAKPLRYTPAVPAPDTNGDAA